jgi:metallophosphoesterase (TIGR03768 family)
MKLASRKDLLFAVTLVSLSLGAKDGQQRKTKLAKYPIDQEIFTTRDRTVVPDTPPASSPKIFPYELSKYQKYGYGHWHYGPGLDCVRRLDLMLSTYKITPATIRSSKSVRLLRFFTLTDVHISDKESPAQAIYLGYKGGLSSGYSGVMLYTPHVLDAAVQTINALHKKNPFDFGIALGDSCNATQYNELRWFIDVLDGKAITPSSGVHAGANTIDYQKPYQATGLDKTIAWYQALGNHDHFWLGFLPVNEYIRRALIGDTILNLGNPIIDPRGAESRGFYVGSIDGRTPYGDIIGVGPVKDFKIPPTVFAKDPDRRSLSRQEWIGEFFNTSSKPKGHGFTRANAQTGFACYTFEPNAQGPIRVMVLDDTQREDDPANPDSLGYGHGSLDQERYDWLIRELDRGQTEDKLMIIAAHIPLGVEPAGSQAGWDQALQETLISKLHAYPNLILWLAGHRHRNAITAFKSPDPKRPELGFWEVETSSLRDFPQQFRVFQIVYNNDNTISIFTTNVDPAVKEGSPAAISRSYAIAAQQIFNNPITSPPTGSYNAELIKPLGPRMPARLQRLAMDRSSIIEP